MHAVIRLTHYVIFHTDYFRNEKKSYATTYLLIKLFKRNVELKLTRRKKILNQVFRDEK